MSRLGELLQALRPTRPEPVDYSALVVRGARRRRGKRAAAVAVVAIVAAGVVPQVWSRPAAVEIEPLTPVPTTVALPTASASAFLSESESASAAALPSPSELATPSVTPVAKPAPSATPTDAAEPPRIQVTMVTDRNHYYAGELVTITVQACNPDPDRTAPYDVPFEPGEDGTDLGAEIQRYERALYFGDGRQEIWPPRREELPPGECLTLNTTWDRTSPLDGSPAPADAYLVRGTFYGHQAVMSAGDGSDTKWVMLHDEPRPADGGETAPLPEKYNRPPEWTLEVTTDASAYQAGDPVTITVTVCNQTDRQQEYSYSDGRLRPFSLSIDDPEADPETESVSVAQLYNDPWANGFDEAPPPYVIEPHACATWTAVWKGTRGEFQEDGTSDGDLVDPGPYNVWVGMAGPYDFLPNAQGATAALTLS